MSKLMNFYMLCLMWRNRKKKSVMLFVGIGCIKLVATLFCSCILKVLFYFCRSTESPVTVMVETALRSCENRYCSSHYREFVQNY